MSEAEKAPWEIISAAIEATLRQEWATPDDLWQVVNAEFKFDIDVCARAGNAKCDNFIPPRDNALSEDVSWLDTMSHYGPRVAWCNPGFARPLPWLEKAWREARKGGVVVVMGLAGCSTEWFDYCARNCTEIRLLSPRVQFVAPPGIKQSSNARENALFVFRRTPRGWPGAHIWRWDWRHDD